MNAPLVTRWTRRTARVQLMAGTASALIGGAIVVALASWWTELPTDAQVLGVVAAPVVAVNAWVSLRTYRRMRGLAVWVTPGGYRGRNHRNVVNGPWADVAAVEIDQSTERLGRLTRQQAIYLVLRDERRVELDALRVDGLSRNASRKQALLEPYRDALETARRDRDPR
jgi:hypothetical protein